jgi:hypothetical protein
MVQRMNQLISLVEHFSSINNKYLAFSVVSRKAAEVAVLQNAGALPRPGVKNQTDSTTGKSKLTC